MTDDVRSTPPPDPEPTTGPATPPAPGSRSRRPGRLAAAGVAVLAVGLIAAGGTAVAGGRDGDGGSGSSRDGGAGGLAAVTAGPASTGGEAHADGPHADGPHAEGAHDGGADTDGEADTDGGAHAGGGPHGRHPALDPYDERLAAATDAERTAAEDLRSEVAATLEAYTHVDEAVAAGYRPPRHPRGQRAHYLDREAATDGRLLDPTRPEGLVYATGGAEPVLIGAVFVVPAGEAAPTPAGDLVVWHSHDQACTGFFATVDEPCRAGRRMLHVWTADEVELRSRRTGEPVAVRVVDPFGAPWAAAVERAG